MPDKKKAVSESSSDAPLVVEIGDGGSGGRGGEHSVPWLRILLACLASSALLVLIILGCFCVAARYSNVLNGFGKEPTDSSSPGSPLYINLAIDTAGLPKCKKSLSNLPCLNGSTMITGEKPMGPLKCIDDAFQSTDEYDVSRGADNCKANRFALAFDGTGVIIPETGVYRVHARVAFVDSVDYYISSSVRIDPASCLIDPICATSRRLRNRRAHTWLSCAVHNGSRSRSGADRFSTCSVDGVRRFNRGDVISGLAAQPYRSINPFHKSTYFFVYKL